MIFLAFSRQKAVEWLNNLSKCLVLSATSSAIGWAIGKLWIPEGNTEKDQHSLSQRHVVPIANLPALNLFQRVGGELDYPASSWSNIAVNMAAGTLALKHPLAAASLVMMHNLPKVHSIPLQPSENSIGFSQFVVDPTGMSPYKTIQSAIRSANLAGGPQTILVRPGTYRENIDFTANLSGGCELTLFGAVALGDEGQCELIGTHTPPNSGSLVIRNFKLTSPNYIFSSDASGNSRLSIIDALFSVTSGYSFRLPNWSGMFEMFDINDRVSQNDGLVLNYGGATVNIFSAAVGAGTNQMTVSGSVNMQSASIGCPLSLQSGSVVDFNDIIFASSVSCLGNSTGSFRFCTLNGGDEAALIMHSSNKILLEQSIIDSSKQAISGSGIGSLILGGIVFSNSNQIANNLKLASSASLLGSLSVEGAITAQGSISGQSLESLSHMQIKNGNLRFNSPGTGLQINTSANGRAGSGILEKGMLFIPNESVTEKTLFYLSRMNILSSNSLGELQVRKVLPGVGFYIESINPHTKNTEVRDDSSFSWFLIEPLEQTTLY